MNKALHILNSCVYMYAVYLVGMWIKLSQKDECLYCFDNLHWQTLIHIPIYEAILWTYKCYINLSIFPY